MNKKLLTILALTITLLLVLASSSVLAFATSSDEFVKGFDKNLELYPNWIVNGQTQPIFTYSQAITEIVYVEVPCDTDRDGLRDRVSVYIMRPRVADGFLCPVMLEHSPYHNGTVGWSRVSGSAFNGDYAYMREPFHYRDNWPIHRDPNDPAFNDTTHLTYNDIKFKGMESFEWPWSDTPFETTSWYTGTNYGNVPAATVSAKDAQGNTIYEPAPSYSWSLSNFYRYYLPRGYALVYGQLLGNRDCDGITNTLHTEEVLSAMAVIKWLNGEAKGYTSRRGNVEVKADWSNGNVAMTGTSYPADISFATVVTGVDGLKAVMPQCNGLNWYDYYRYAGTVNSPGGYGGEDMNLHASYNFSRFNADSSSGVPPANGQWFPKSVQDVFFETQKHMMEKQDSVTGNYNAEWEMRNFGRHVANINEDVGLLMTTGFMDWNSQPKLSMANWTVLLDKCPGTFREFASISSHASQAPAVIHGKSVIEWWHLWMDHFCLGLDNGVTEALPDITVINTKTGAVEGYNVNKDAQPGDEDFLERGGIVPGAKNQKLYLVPAQDGKAGRLSYKVPGTAVEKFSDMDILDMLQATYPGAPTLTAAQKTIGTSSDGNYRVTSTQALFCEGRAVGANRTYNFGISATTPADIQNINNQLFAAVDKPVEGRLMYLSEPLTEDVRLSGTGVVYVNAAPDRAVGNLSAAVVEVGRVRNMESSRANAWSMSAGTGNNLLTAAPYTLPYGGGISGNISIGTFRNPSEVGTFMNYKYVTVGYADIMNPNYSGKVWFEVPEQNYIPDFYFQTTKIVPGKYYPYTIELDPYDYVFRAGSQIGVMVFGSDPDYSLLYDKDGIAQFDIAIGPDSYAVLPLLLDEPTEPITLAVSSTKAVPGDLVEIVYGFDNNDYGFCSFNMELPYDSSSLVPVAINHLVDPQTAGYNMETVFGSDALYITFASDNGENIIVDGGLFTVTYKVLADTPYIPLDVKVNEVKYSSFIDKLVEVDVIVKAGKISSYDFNLYMTPQQTILNAGDTLYVDLMLAGQMNYTQVAAEISFDTALLTYASYENLTGWVAAVTAIDADKISVRSMPSSNMVLGASCSPEIRIATLKFTVKDNFAGPNIDTVLDFASLNVLPAGTVKDWLSAPAKPLVVTLSKPAVLTDYEIVKQFVVDDMHAAEYCTENAVTTREFAPNTIMTNGVIDPFFAKGGTQFFPTDRPSGKGKIYVIAVDFADLKGAVGVPYGVQRNIFRNQGSIYDLSDPQIIYESTFFGSNGFKPSIAGYEQFGVNGVKNMHPDKFVWGTTDAAQDFKGLVQIVNEVSLGHMNIEVECLNERLAEVLGMDAQKDKWPWFHLDGPMIGYAVQGPADCEDYRQFSRLHQAGIDAAVRDIPGLDIEDADFIYTIVPISAFGHRAGLQGGGGLDTSFSFNDQALLQREGEYRHEPGITTPGGRIIGSGVFGIKNLWSSGNPRSAVNTSMHEFLHGMGMFDDYSYGSMGVNPGEVTTGSKFGSDTQDLTSWKKYRQGWIADDEIKVVLPGESDTFKVRAQSTYAGDGGNYTDDPSIKTRMIVIPKEWRTRDTFGTLWNNGWNANKLDYNWYDWFTNPFIGGETRAIKSFPTFYTVEVRYPFGADNTMTGTNFGTVVSMISNPTWETGHGAGGFKRITANALRVGATTAWRDPVLGLTVEVLSSNVFWDEVKVTYNGTALPTGSTTAPGPAKHIYQGVLTASDNYVQANDTFTVDFDILTIGASPVNDGNDYTNSNVVRTGTPLGVPGGLAGFEMKVEFDAANFEYVSFTKAPFNYTINTTQAGAGQLLIKATGSQMINKDTILSLNFKAKAGAAMGNYAIKATVSDVTLINWRGKILRQGTPGFDGVGTFKVGGITSTDPLADLYKFSGSGANVTHNGYTEYEPAIYSKGGLVKVGAASYGISGQITCQTPGPEPGTFIGIESQINLYNSADVLIATTKSDWYGNYSIKGIPAGTGYYITVGKPKYVDGHIPTFDIIAADVTKNLQLDRVTFNVSGTIYAGVNSDGTGALPLAGVDVYVINIGNAYKVLGGPYKTGADGAYSINTLVETWSKPFAAVAVDVAGTDYKHQMLVKHNGEYLKLNLGRLYGIDPNDRVYPANTATYGVGNGYNFLVAANVSGRNVTLTKLQDVHLRTVTKSTAYSYQLRDLEGNAVGAPLQSVGTTNGDDILQNVAPGDYYIEVSRAGYLSACTMPFGVDTTRVFLRNAFTTNTLDLVALDSATRLTGTVLDAITGLPIDGVKFELVPYSATRGRSILTLGANGGFDVPDPTGEKDLIFSKPGYKSVKVNIASGGVSALEVKLTPDSTATIADLEEIILEVAEEGFVAEEEYEMVELVEMDELEAAKDIIVIIPDIVE